MYKYKMDLNVNKIRSNNKVKIELVNNNFQTKIINFISKKIESAK